MLGSRSVLQQARFSRPARAFSFYATLTPACSSVDLGSGLLQTAIQFGSAVLLAITTAVFTGHGGSSTTGAAMDDYHAGWWVPLIAALVSLLLVTLGIPAARRGERAAADDATNTATEGIAA